MFGEEITEKDADILNDIIDNNYTIRSLYKHLLFMEITNNKDTNNYSRCLDNLKKSIKLEKEYYSKLNLTPIKAKKIMRYLFNSNGYHEEDNNVLTAIYTSGLNELEFYRLLNRLEEYGNRNDDIYVQYLKGDPLVIKHDDLRNMILVYQLKKAADIDFEKAFIYFNQKEIDQCIDEDTRDQLINIKYFLSFISENIEELFVNSRFEVNDNLYFSLMLQSDLMRVPRKSLDIIQLNLGYRYCIKAINEMMHYDIEEEYLDLEIENTIWSSYLKAGTTFFFHSNHGDEKLNEIKNQVFDANEQVHSQASQATDFIFNCFDEAQEEKKSFKYLSLFKK